MAKRADVLEFAVLGLLQDNPMHGYELRKRLNGVLGTFRAISYGSLYPCLKGLLRQGLIEEDTTGATGELLAAARDWRLDGVAGVVHTAAEPDPGWSAVRHLRA